MYPSQSNPAFGSFVKELDDTLENNFGTSSKKALLSSNKKGVFITPLKYLSLLAKTTYHTLFSKFDVIYAHYIFPTGFIALLPKFIRSKPLIIMSHGGDANIPKKFSYFKTMIRYVLKKSDAIIAVSNFLKNQIVDDFGVETDKISVIDCGVNVDKFSPNNKTETRQLLKLPTDKKIILYVGTLIGRKGVETLVRAIIDLNDKNIFLCVIGEGYLRQQLTDLVEENSISDKVRFENFKPKNELPNWFNCADIFVLPSLTEPFGLVALEAMSCGIPVIASNVGGLPEFVKDGINGYIFEPSDHKELSEKIELALNLEPVKYFELSRNAQKTAQEHSIQNQAAKIFRLLAKPKKI